MKISRLLLTVAFLAGAQDPLTNEAVMKMVKSGMTEGIVVDMIQSQPGKYSLTADELIKLKEAGVSDKVLSAMIAKNSSAAASPPAASSAGQPAPVAVTDPDVPKDTDVGVYFKKSTGWEAVLPEIVDWKTGGVLKSIGTVGIVKGDVNGHIQGAHSRNSIKSPVELLIHTPEGVEYTEYQLIRLREHGDNREFRTVTGGVLHVSGGSTRDVVPFDAKPAGKRIWKVVLPALGAGEYGLLPPGSFAARSTSKMYTFHLLE